MKPLRCAIATDIGLVREENQDQVNAMEFSGNILAAVCDGMGGERCGSQASEIAIRELFDHFKTFYRSGMDWEEIRALLFSSISAANSVVYSTAKLDYRSFGMGTTCVVAFVTPERVFIANVGDSRAYLVRDGRMRLLTSDHTLVNLLYRQGKITREEMKTHPKRNMLTKAVGVERVVKPSFYQIPLEPDYKLLLCSDGLSSYCEEQEILEIMLNNDFADIPQALVNLSLRKGGRDNISLAIVTE